MKSGKPFSVSFAREHPVLLEVLEPRLLLDGNPDLWPLDLPDENIADLPVMQPSVVTAGGQRLLLNYFNNNGNTPADDVTVTYDPRTDQLVSNKPGWWIINYPLDQILGLPNINSPSGLTDAQIKDLVAADLFGPGKTASDVRNWYVLTPVDADHPLAAEPNAPTAPAPITATDLSNAYILVVDNDTSHTVAMTDPWVSSRIAAATNAIVDTTVYRTIQAAVNRIPQDGHFNTATKTVTMKTVILVVPGVGPYREFVGPYSVSGSEDYPLIFEGVPDANGKMPMISGAEKFANNSWTLESVLGDVNVSGDTIYRANIPFNYDANNWGTKRQRLGYVAADDQTFIERSNPAFLKEGEVAYNIGSTEFLNMYGMAENSTLTAVPSTGQTPTAGTVDAGGYLNFAATNQVVWVDTWVWVPQPTGCGYLNTGMANFPDNYTYGPFRATPFSNGAPVDNQANPYRLWVNGQAAGQIYNSADDYEQNLPHPDTRGYNPFSKASDPIEDDWVNLTLNVGWNHLVFQFDTSVACRYQSTAQGTNPYYTEAPYWQQPLAFKFTVSGCNYVSGVISQATRPADLNQAPTGTAYKYISAYNVLGTFAATTADNGVYVRLTDQQSLDRNPNSVMTELANRSAAFSTDWLNGTGNYVQFRGFDCRFGGIAALGIGDLVEGNFVRDSAFGTNNDSCSPRQRLNFTFSGGNAIAISGSNLAAGDAVAFGGGYVPSPLLAYHAYFIGANQPSTNLWELFESAADARAGYNAIVLSGAGSDILYAARGSTADAPTVDRNNWILNAGTAGRSFNTMFVDDVNQNLQDGILDLPGLGRLIFEYNRIINFNPRGMWFGWDTAGIKSGGVVSGVYSYNVFDGGAGLGIWLDTNNFNNRFDGNLFLNMHSAALNIEASPGANLMANNIIVSAADNNGGDISTWSCNRDWAVNNTINRGEAYSAAVGMGVNENEQRYSPWNDPNIPTNTWPHDPVWPDALDARQAYVNNLFLNINTAMGADVNPFTPDVVAGNYTNNAADVTVSPFFQAGQDATAHYLSDSYMALADPDNGDYRLTASSALNNLGATDVQAWTNTFDGIDTYSNLSDLVTHDFYGLLRFLIDGSSVGATRSYHNYTSTTLEVQYADGTIQRLEKWPYMAGRWKLDETGGTMAADSSGNNLTATVSGGPAWNANGYLGGGLALNGSNQYAYVADNNAFDFSAAAPFTISAWVKLSGTISGSGTYYPILSHGSADPYWELSLRGNGAATYNGVYLQVNGVILKPTLDKSSVFNDHAWHLVTATRDGSGNGTLYIDGVSVGTATGLNLDTTNAGQLQIGRCGAGYFPGTLDDVRMYGRALSSVEAAALRDVPMVSVSATDNQASELGNTGTFTVTRTAGSTNLPLIVRYTTAGTAANGADYAPLAGIVTIPAGQSSATITVAPVDTAFGNNETVIVNLAVADDASTQYNLTGNTSATVTLVSSANQIARWKLDETSGTTAVDSSGNAFNATVSGEPTWNTNGYLAGGLTLSGSGQYAYLADNNAFDFSATAPFTLSAWVKLSGTISGSSTYYPIISHGSADPYWELSLRGNGAATYNGVYLQVNGAILKPTSDQSSVFNDHAWHLVTAARDGSGNGTLYIDGVSVGTATGLNLDTTNTGELDIGRCGGNYFPGAMDDVRMYGRTLSSAEVAALRNVPTMSISATDNRASELGDTGTFTVTRTGSTTNALTVHYTVSGSGTTNGTNYVRLPGTIVIPAGRSSATITVTPIDPAIGSGGTVILTLAADPDSQYELSHPLGAATVNLVSPANVVAYWKFNDGSGSTAADSSGNNLNGTLLNGATWGSGQVNGGLTLDGVNDYVNVPVNSANNSKLSFGTGGFTLSAWVKLAPTDNLTNVNYPIISIGNPGSGKNMTLYLSNQGNYEWTLGMFFLIQGSGRYYTYQCPYPDVSNILRDHQWHMVTVTRDADGAGRLYLDGSTIMINLGGGQGRVSSLNMSFPVLNLTNDNSNLYIGRDATGANYFKGSLDNILVYNRGLSDSEVMALASPPTVSIQADDDQASESGDTGSFTVNSSAVSDHDLTIYYTIGGTAANGVDYAALSGSVTIQAGQTSATILITPLYDELVEGPENVQLTLLGSANYVLGESGDGTDTATVTIADVNLNVPPTASNDAVTVYTGSGWNFIDVLANDTCLPDISEVLTVESVGPAGHGTASLVGNYVFYVPHASFVGEDSFTYVMSDGHGGTDTATVVVTVIDPPEARLKVWLDVDPVSSGDYSVRIWAQIIHGQTGNGVADMAVTIYTPGSVGATVPLQVSEWFTDVVTEWNPAVSAKYMRIDARAYDYDGDGDMDARQMTLGSNSYNWPNMGLTPVLLATETWTMLSNQYVPLAVNISPSSRHWDSNGTRKVAFAYFEGVGAMAGVVLPEAYDDAFEIQEDSLSNALNVLTNDMGGSSLEIIGAGPAGHGTVAFSSNQVFYTPAADYFGADSFTYLVTNASGQNSTATVTLTVNNVNDPPTAVDDSATVFAGSQGNVISVLPNDTYLPDAPETLTVTSLSQPSHGTARLTRGVVQYWPQTGYTGSDSFTYTVSDGHGGTDSATVAVSVIDPAAPRLKVWLVANPVSGGEYSVEVWAQIIHGVAGQGIADAAITIYTPGSVNATVPVEASAFGKEIAMDWNPAITARYLTLSAVANDYDLDGDTDAVQMCLGGTSYNWPNMGLAPVLLATQTWTMLSSSQPVYLAVYVSPSSRHWDSQGGQKVEFDYVEGQGLLVPSWARGDVNHDTLVNAADIDALYANFGADAQYDLTSDSIVNQADVDELVKNILRTGYGDANLDRKVDFLDFQALLDHWQLSATWATGNWNGDDKCDFLDFQMLLDNWNPNGFPGAAEEPFVAASSPQTTMVAMAQTTASTEASPAATGTAQAVAPTGMLNVQAPAVAGGTLPVDEMLPIDLVATVLTPTSGGASSPSPRVADLLATGTNSYASGYVPTAKTTVLAHRPSLTDTSWTSDDNEVDLLTQLIKPVVA